MKLKRFLAGTLLAAVATTGMSAMSFAAENSISVGKPINIETGKEATSYSAGDIIAVPVEITTSTGKLTSYKVLAKYDTDYITPEVDGNDDATYELLEELGDPVEKVADTSVYGALNNLKNAKGTKYYGNMAYEQHYQGHEDIFGMNWAYGTNVAVNASAPEAYIIFTVNKDIPADALNVSVAAAVEGEYIYVSDTIGGLEETEVTQTSEATVNVAKGAVKLTVDGSALNKWVQNLYISVNGGEAVSIPQYVDNGDGTYSFPVRIVSDNSDAVTVKFYADLSDTEDGEVTDSKVSVGEKEISLNSPSSYEAVSYSAE